MFEGDTGEPDWDGGDHDHPRQALVSALNRDLSITQAASEAAKESSDDPGPVCAEVPEQSQSRGAVQSDEEGEVERLLTARL